MNVRRSAFCAILLLVSSAWAQGVDVPNPSFEQGGDSPDGWVLSGGKGLWLKEGAADGTHAVAVTGDGRGSNSWQTRQALAWSPGGVYRLTFRARSTDASGGTATTGAGFCNVDIGVPPTSWRQYEYYFVAPETIAGDASRLRFGQYEVKGTIAYDDIQLAVAHPTYMTQGELVLGDGEAIHGHEYTFRARLDSVGRMQSRPLQSHRCQFNSNRWVFDAGGVSVVTYRHCMGGRKQSAAKVDVGISYYTGGQLVVEASADGQASRELGMLGKVQSKSLEIPADMQPAENIWIRLRVRPAEGKKGGMLQVSEYSFRSTLDGDLADAVGATRFICVSGRDERFNLAVEGIGPALPGGKNEVVAVIENISGQSEHLSPEVTVCVDKAAPRDVQSFSADVFDLPGGAKKTIRVPYQVPGAGKWRVGFGIGKSPLVATATVNVPGLYESRYGQVLPPSTQAVGLWWASSGWKIARGRLTPTEAGKEVLIRAAKNEAEAAQLVVRPAKTLKGLTVKAGPLMGANGASLPAACVEVLQVVYVPVTHPTDSTSVAADWPDPLPPLTGPIDVPAGTNQPLWVRVKVPAAAAAGEYRGAIHLSADGGYSADVPLAVEVYDFTLPERMTCQTAFGFSPENVWRYQKITDANARRAVLDKYLRNFSEHHIAPYNPAPLDGFKVSWPKLPRGADPNALVPTIDWTAWDAAMTRAMDEYHFNTFVIHIEGMGGGTFQKRYEPSLLGYSQDTPQYRAAFTAYCRAVQEHLRQKGWLDRAFIYWFDEPGRKDYDFVANGMRWLKEAAGDLRRMMTVKVEPELVGGVNLWCPVSFNYDHQRAEERRAAGEHFWWYVCCGPKAPYCTLFIDHPGTELRVWLWQTWQRKIDGILVWETNYWTSPAAYPDRDHPQNPYDDPMGWVSDFGGVKGAKMPWGNGDGRFIYPPPAAADAHPAAPVLDGPVDSIRLEMLRDGIEDYEYLAILRGLLAQKRAKLTATDRAALEALLEVPANITADMTTFTTDPAAIERRRDEIARAIMRLRLL